MYHRQLFWEYLMHLNIDNIHHYLVQAIPGGMKRYCEENGIQNILEIRGIV